MSVTGYGNSGGSRISGVAATLRRDNRSLLVLDVSAELEYQSTHSAIRSGTDDARDCASDSTVASLRVLRCEELLIPSALRVALNILVPHENTHVHRLICCPNTSSSVKKRGGLRRRFSLSPSLSLRLPFSDLSPESSGLAAAVAATARTKTVSDALH